MLNFEFYSDGQKRAILIIGIAGIISIIAVLYTFFFGNVFKNDTIEIKNNTLSMGQGVLSPEENTKSGENFAQIYVYPGEYDFHCNGNAPVCTTLLANTEKLAHIPLAFEGRNINNDQSDVDLNFNFEDTGKINSIMKEIFSNLFTASTIEKENAFYDSCVQSIKESIPAGTAGAEETIQERSQQECSGMEGKNETAIALGGYQENAENNTITLSLEIKKLHIVYQFFSKEKGEFNKTSSKEESIVFETTLSSALLLSDLK